MATYTLSVASAGTTTGHWGDIALVFTGSAGAGASASGTGTGVPSLNLTTTGDNSAIAVLILDANAVSGSSRSWLALNGYTPTSGNGYELDYTLDTGNYGAYVAYYPDAGPAGSVKTVGLSAPAGTKYTIVAVEILGSPGGTGADTGTGDDEATVTATIPAADTGTGVDTGAAALQVLAADTGTGADTATQTTATAVTGADTGSGAESATFTPGADVNDTGASTDAASVVAYITADTYTDAYAGTYAPGAGPSDTVSGDDEASVTAGPSFPQIPLGLSIQMLINGTWTDITSFVYARSDVQITRGRPDETQQVQPSQCTMVLDNRDGRFSLSNPSGAYAPYLTRNVQLRVSVTASVALPSGNPGPAPTALYSGYRFWGEIASIEQHWDPSGTDRWVNLTASGPLRRYSQGDATIGSALRRYYTRLSGSTAPYAYWPAEDASGAQEIASALSGVAAMGYSGTPSFGSDSSFGGSDSIPAVNGSSWHGQTLAAETPPGTGSLTENTAGTFFWTCPPGVTEITGVLCTGGGGGGGSWGNTKGGGGGGGGASAQAASIGVTAGVTYSYTVGPGGTPGGSPGTAGGTAGISSFTGDTETLYADGGIGGSGGDNSAGGSGAAAGTGGYQGGSGGTGQASTTVPMNLFLTGTAGATGATGASVSQTTYSWTVPPEVETLNITLAGAGGGGQGGGAYAEGYGGGGGGGGGKATGTIDVTAGDSYSMLAGNGGAGGANGAGGLAGGASEVAGDSGTSAISYGGGGGGGAGAGGFATSAGSDGGNGARSATGEGMGGGGGGGGGAGSSGQSAGGNAGTSGDPRPPGGGGQANGTGGGWGAVSSGGSGATNGGTGKTSSLVAGGGGGGGGGAVTNTTGNGGGGGGAGWIFWAWNQPGVPAGGGGGSSAGTSGTGGAGGTDGAGGDAVTGGGAGGNQGLAGTSPGGGGGGGVPDTGNLGAGTVNPGAGAPGQVSFSWSGGTTSPVAADIVRFALSVDDTGGTQPSYDFTATDASPAVFTASGSTYANGTPVQVTGDSLPTGFNALTTYYVVAASTDTFSLAATSGGTALNSSSTGSGSVASTAGWVIARILTYGTASRMDVTYYPGGELDLSGWNSSGTQLWDSGHVLFGVDGVPLYVDVELVADGANATWHINTVQPGAADQEGLSGTVSGVSVGYVSDVYISPDSDVTFASAGQVAVQTYADSIVDMAQVIAGYSGELAATRIARLAGEENLAFELVGNVTDTPKMGAQQDDTFVNVLQSCEDMDQGKLYEPRDSFGIAYRTRISMQGQSPLLTLDYSQKQLAAELVPVADDQYTRNYITVTRNAGSNVTATLTSGAMSTAPPPAGVGTYVYTVTVYGYADTQLVPLAGWLLTVGTVADERYPVVVVDLTRPEVATLFATIPSLDVGAYIQVINAPSWLTNAPIQQLTSGFTETINGFKWTISHNSVPESPYSTGNPPTW